MKRRNAKKYEEDINEIFKQKFNSQSKKNKKITLEKYALTALKKSGKVINVHNFFRDDMFYLKMISVIETLNKEKILNTPEEFAKFYDGILLLLTKELYKIQKTVKNKKNNNTIKLLNDYLTISRNILEFVHLLPFFQIDDIIKVQNFEKKVIIEEREIKDFFDKNDLNYFPDIFKDLIEKINSKIKFNNNKIANLIEQLNKDSFIKDSVFNVEYQEKLKKYLKVISEINKKTGVGLKNILKETQGLNSNEMDKINTVISKELEKIPSLKQPELELTPGAVPVPTLTMSPSV